MDTDNLIGTRVGEFLIRERIGRGGMASVYLARQSPIGREVALKIIPLDGTGPADDAFRRRFEREANLIASLEHIHILPVYDYGLTGDAAYLAMRLLRGGTLADRLRAGPLPVEEAAELFHQFASGLHYAHRHGVIHRDLKPSNILLDDSGNVLLADFGLAKHVQETADLTRTGTVVGTPVYMSPEQIMGRPLDARSDLYSAGVVLYEMLAGRPPFGGDDADMVATLARQIHDTPQPLRRIDPSVPVAVEAVVMRALRKEPERRQASMEEMARDLRRATGDSSGSLGSPFRAGSGSAGASASAGSGARGGRWVLGVAAAAAVAACVFVMMNLVRDASGPPDAPPAAVVRTGERGTAADAAPTGAEVARAKERLGSNGFLAHVAATQRTEYHATQTREMTDLARKYGLPYRVYDSDGDDYGQLTQIEKARVDGATGIILCPLNTDLLETPLQSAQAAGLPMVFMASGMPSYGGVLIAGDDYEMGRKAGRFAGGIVAREKGGRAGVVILDFPGVPSLVRRAEGLRDGLAEEAPVAVVVAHARGGTREFALDSIAALLKRGQAFDVVLSINDAGAFGAITALERADVAPDEVVIASVDAEALARDYIARGYFLRGSVATKREEFSEATVGAMVKLLAGSAVPETIVVEPGEVVTRETAAPPSP